MRTYSKCSSSWLVILLLLVGQILGQDDGFGQELFGGGGDDDDGTTLESICYVTDGPGFNGPQSPDSECKFPFIWESNTYVGCITIGDPESKLWCSTKVSDHAQKVSEYVQ